MMQAASDIYLGWTEANIPTTHHFYWRQLRDMKGSPDVETMAPTTLTFYARACGWTLARAHARSGDPIAIAAYLGRRDRFDRSITDFAERYATRTTATTRRSARRSGPAACRPSRGSRKVCWILGAWTFR
jgi:sugar/nucleoside kinase (ribokinase family)